MKLYCTRHGQTVWNEKNLVCGLTDVELTDLGRAQADALGKELENKGNESIQKSGNSCFCRVAAFITETASVELCIKD